MMTPRLTSIRALILIMSILLISTLETWRISVSSNPYDYELYSPNLIGMMPTSNFLRGGDFTLSSPSFLLLNLPTTTTN